MALVVGGWWLVVGGWWWLLLQKTRKDGMTTIGSNTSPEHFLVVWVKWWNFALKFKQALPANIVSLG